MDLYIDSGSHAVTDPAGRVSQAESELGSPDVVFIEEPNETIELREEAFLFLYAPILSVMMILWEYVIVAGLQRFFGSDRNVGKELIEKYDTDRISVDIPHSVQIYENRKLWGWRTGWRSLGPFLGEFRTFRHYQQRIYSCWPFKQS